MTQQCPPNGWRARPGVERFEPRDCPAVAFQNDYSQDVYGYFTAERRALVEYAQQQLAPYLQDDLAAITPDPAGGSTWSVQFQNTATGQNVVVDNPTIPANVIRVYWWGAPQSSFSSPNTLATGGETGANISGYKAWTDTVLARGQAGRLSSPATDTSVSVIRVDVNQDVRFYESTAPPADPTNTDVDLVSVLQHELLHGLGLTNSNPAVVRWVQGQQFVGPNVTAVAGGSVPVAFSHWLAGTTIGGVPALMDPVIYNHRLTPLDVAALADIGWQTAPSASPPPPQTLGNTGTGDGDSDHAHLTPPSALTGRFSISQDRGGDVAAIGNPNGTPALLASPFPDFAGGVRTALADFNGDGIPDLVAGTGPGVPTRVRILDGQDLRELFSISPFEASFTGGVFVAAGDLDGDLVPDLVISPDEGGGPRCRVFRGTDFAPMADFIGIADANFRGGARVAVADVNGDGVGDLIVAAGFGGGPRVAGYDGRSVSGGTPTPMFADFFAFEQELRNGVFIAGGDLDADGFADLVIGAGPGGSPRVLSLSGRALIRGQRTTLGDFFSGGTDTRGGIHVAARDLDADGRADVITGSGENSGSRVEAYNSAGLRPGGGTPPLLLSKDFSKSYNSGLFVG